MSAYCFFNNVEIYDETKMAEYREAVTDIVRKYQGEYVVVGGTFQIKEGKPKVTLPVVIKFPSLELANRWYNSKEYAPLLKLRKSAGEFDAVFMEGP